MDKLTILKPKQNFFSKLFPTLYFYTNLFKFFLSAYFELIINRFSWNDYVNYCRKILDTVTKCGTEVVLENLEELKNVNYPVVFVSNHMSSLETLIFGYILGKYTKFTFVLKKSLLYYPVFGKILKFLKPIAVKRKNPKEDFEVVLKEAKKLLKEKVSIVVFPQATRSLIIDEKKFNSIGIKIAKFYKIGILPIYVKTDFLSIGKIFKDIGKVNPKNKVYIKVFSYILPEKINKFTHNEIVDLLKKENQKFIY
jgi:1-acyl-sn-glycerol-3-phosphate acyltransferase